MEVRVEKKLAQKEKIKGEQAKTKINCGRVLVNIGVKNLLSSDEFRVRGR
jgi:hypothetical protein